MIFFLFLLQSSSLIASCLEEKEVAAIELAQKLASSGFRDTSRVGGGNPELGVMMAKYNQKAVLRSLRIYRQQLDIMIRFIEEEDWNQVEMMLGETKGARSLFTTKK